MSRACLFSDGVDSAGLHADCPSSSRVARQAEAALPPLFHRMYPGVPWVKRFSYQKRECAYPYVSVVSTEKRFFKSSLYKLNQSLLKNKNPAPQRNPVEIKVIAEGLALGLTRCSSSCAGSQRLLREIVLFSGLGVKEHQADKSSVLTGVQLGTEQVLLNEVPPERALRSVTPPSPLITPASVDILQASVDSLLLNVGRIWSLQPQHAFNSDVHSWSSASLPASTSHLGEGLHGRCSAYLPSAACQDPRAWLPSPQPFLLFCSAGVRSPVPLPAQTLFAPATLHPPPTRPACSYSASLGSSLQDMAHLV